MHLLRNVFYVVLVLSLGILASYFVNLTNLQLLVSDVKTVTPENINTLRSQLKQGEIVEVAGTLDSLHLISDNVADVKSTNYFSGLREYPNALIIKFKNDKLAFNKQTFKGTVVFLGDDQTSTEIIGKLNSSIDFNNSLNVKAAVQINEAIKQQIINNSKGEFSKNSILLLDGVLIDTNGIYLNTILVFIVVSLFLIVLFRKRIFKLRRQALIAEP